MWNTRNSQRTATVKKGRKIVPSAYNIDDHIGEPAFLEMLETILVNYHREVPEVSVFMSYLNVV